MAGVNPLAGAASAGASDPVAAELQALAADTQALQALLQEGDVVQATVLPFNGVTDLIDVLGLQVAASLPPGVFPGDTVTLEVQGFQGNTILVKLTATDPPADGGVRTPGALVEDGVELTQTPVPVVVDPELLPPAANVAPGGLPPSVTPSGGSPLGSAPPVPTQSDPTPAGGTPAQAPPTAVFVAASVQTSSRSGAGSAAPTPAASSAAPPSAEALSVEARLALTRAAPYTRPRGPIPPLPGTSSSAAARPAAAGQAPPGASRPAPAVPPGLAPRPAYLPIAPRQAAKRPPPPLPGAPAPIRGNAGGLTAPAAARTPAPVVPSALLEDPAALLRTLRIPVSPTSLAFAKLVTSQPEQVATALRALETGLPDGNDARIQTLRTLATFVGTLDPKSPTFTTQVSAYLSNVVEGPEPKLLALVAQRVSPAEGAQAEPGPAQAAPGSATPPPSDPSAAAAQTAERTAAAASDLKTQLLSILTGAGGAQPGLDDAGTAVVQNAVTALATAQLSTLATQQLQPGSWTLTIPIMIDRQLVPAKVVINRDKPDEKSPLTGDDFHIAFVLDTPRLGTVVVNLHAVGRAVSVSVKTEREIAAASFKSGLSQLGERLESMKYNVKSLDAGVAPPRPAEAIPPIDQPPAAVDDESTGSVDSRA